jgi:hypothetical protein
MARYKRNFTEQTIAAAAGLMKDWTTSLIQLQTAALGVIGALAGYTDLSKLVLPPGQIIILALTAIAFTVSLFFGVLLLNLFVHHRRRTNRGVLVKWAAQMVCRRHISARALYCTQICVVRFPGAPSKYCVALLNVIIH